MCIYVLVGGMHVCMYGYKYICSRQESTLLELRVLKYNIYMFRTGYRTRIGGEEWDAP